MCTQAAAGRLHFSETRLNPVWARACAWTLLAGGWGSVYSHCVWYLIFNQLVCRLTSFLCCETGERSVRWTRATAQHRRWGCKTLKVCDSSCRTGFGLMCQGLVWSLLIVHGIVYPARTAVDGISGSPPAGFMLYYAVLICKAICWVLCIFLFCTDFNSVACLGMMWCNGHRPGQGKQALYINVT